MKTINTDHRRTLVLFLSVIVLGVLIYFSGKLQDQSFDRTSASVIALKPVSISEIKVFSGKSSKEILVIKANSPKDNEIISKFGHAINQAQSAEPPFRELILSHELYLVVNRNNSDKPIELLLNRHTNCNKTVYITIVKKGRIFDSTVFIGGAKSETYLYEWLQSLGLLSALGCD